MKKMIMAITLILSSTSVFAQASNIDCYHPSSQAEINYCAEKKLQKTKNELMDLVSAKCSQSEEVVESAGGSMHPMIMSDCQTTIIKQLIKRAEKINVD